MLPSMATDDAAAPRNLHDLAVDAADDIQQLAVGLAHAGASPQAVQQLTTMHTILSQVVKVLAGGGPGGPPGAPPPGGPPGAPPPGGPPGAPPPGGPVPPAHESMQAASQHLHSAMIASAQERAQGRPPGA